MIKIRKESFEYLDTIFEKMGNVKGRKRRRYFIFQAIGKPITTRQTTSPSFVSRSWRNSLMNHPRHPPQP